MGAPSIGSVVMVPFPYSDLSQSKLRPVVVLADAERGDWVLCQITSKPYSDSRAVKLTDADFESGSLQLVSYARPGKLFTGNETNFRREVGVLKSASLQRVRQAASDLLQGK